MCSAMKAIAKISRIGLWDDYALDTNFINNCASHSLSRHWWWVKTSMSIRTLSVILYSWLPNFLGSCKDFSTVLEFATRSGPPDLSLQKHVELSHFAHITIRKETVLEASSDLELRWWSPYLLTYSYELGLCRLLLILRISSLTIQLTKLTTLRYRWRWLLVTLRIIPCASGCW